MQYILTSTSPCTPSEFNLKKSTFPLYLQMSFADKIFALQIIANTSFFRSVLLRLFADRVACHILFN